MAKLRKMLGRVDSPHIVTLMRLIETQSKATICRWCIDFAAAEILPIWNKYRPGDARPAIALVAAEKCLRGEVKLPEVKKLILDCHEAARECEDEPAAQAAARTIGQAAASIHAPAHSLGLAFYGTAAIAYDRLGTDAAPTEYDKLADAEGDRIARSFKAIMVDGEANPAKINWNC